MTAPIKATASHMNADWRSELNEAQLRAVDHEGGPLLVAAGAGTGKTKTVAYRVGRLIERGARPERILLLTFTRRAAGEMIARAGSVVGEDLAEQVWHGTFHGVAYRLLRTYGKPLGLGDGFSVIDEGDAADLVGLVRDEVIPSLSRRRVSAEGDVADDPLAGRQYPEPPSRRADGALSFALFGRDRRWSRCSTPIRSGSVRSSCSTSMTCCCIGAAPPWPAAKPPRRSEDSSTMSWSTNTRTPTPCRPTSSRRRPADATTVMAVGDDAQAIYAFRGATIRNILDFPKRNPGTTIIKLEENYRSTPEILAVANAVLAEATDGFAKRLHTSSPSGALPSAVRCRDEQSEATAVCDAVLEVLRERRTAPRAGGRVSSRSSQPSS